MMRHGVDEVGSSFGVVDAGLGSADRTSLPAFGEGNDTANALTDFALSISDASFTLPFTCALERSDK